MPKTNNKIRVTIDNKAYEVKKGLTILEAAQQNDIYIPTLCAHKDLSNYGGCRLCLVEVENMRGFPTSCTTPVEEGMIIRTKTAQIEEERVEILRLLLSEHTSSCLICDEADECKNYMGTIRKVGVTTGCRYCASDGQCELQDVVHKMGITDITHPIYYRNMRIEKEDPFYDRDYNLCILCGRCIRMCQEVRTANTLAFKQRGRHTIIGPAFFRTHYEAGCEFCGACVEVCPTGTLSEKARKWDGKPDREVETTCSYCGVGCQMRLIIKNDQVIGALPSDDDIINNGQLCLKGRFCVNEMVNQYQRMKVPYKKLDETNIDILWKEAIHIAAEKISACKPGQFAMVVSPNVTNEDLYVAQKFTRIISNSDHIDTLTRVHYGTGFNAYIDLLKKSVPLAKLQEASVILSVGLDARFGRSVVGVEIRKAIKNGAKIITLHPRDHSLSVISDQWLQPEPGQENDFLGTLAKLTGTKSGKFQENKLWDAAALLKESKNTVILVGSEFTHYDKNHEIFDNIGRIAKNTGAGIIPLPAQNNLIGTLLMGTYPEIIPGGYSRKDKGQLAKIGKKWSVDLGKNVAKWDSSSTLSSKKQKVLYLLGEIPLDERPVCDFLIYQNIYPANEPYDADLMLPAAAFTEIDGTFINGEGRIQRIRQGVKPPGQAMPDWQIICKIAKKMGYKGFEFKNVKEIRAEIAEFVKGFGEKEINKRKPLKFDFMGKIRVNKKSTAKGKKDNGKLPFVLSASFVEHSYRGYHLSEWVEGAGRLFPNETINMNPGDAKKIGLEDGDKIKVSSNGFEKTWPIRIVKEQPSKSIHVILPAGSDIPANPYPVKVRKANV